jgi:hypothetical protein
MRWHQTINIINPVPGSTNEYGDINYSDASPVPSPAWVQPREATEEEINRQTRISEYHILVPPEAPVSGVSKITWEGKEMQVIGEPQPFHHRNGLHHLEFDAREILG